MTQPAIRIGVKRADLVFMRLVSQTAAPLSNQQLCGHISSGGMNQSAAQP
jgi:hypothetical protein